MKFSNVSIKINDDIFISSSQYIDLNKVSRVDIRQVNTLSLLQLEYLNCIFKLIEAILHYVEFEIIFGCYRFWAQATLLWTKNFCFLFLTGMNRKLGPNWGYPQFRVIFGQKLGWGLQIFKNCGQGWGWGCKIKENCG